MPMEANGSNGSDRSTCSQVSSPKGKISETSLSHSFMPLPQWCELHPHALQIWLRGELCWFCCTILGRSGEGIECHLCNGCKWQLATFPLTPYKKPGFATYSELDMDKKIIELEWTNVFSSLAAPARFEMWIPAPVTCWATKNKAATADSGWYLTLLWVELRIFHFVYSTYHA